MASEVLYGINEWFLLALTVGILYAGAELGYRYGRRFADRTPPEIHSHVATVEGALLGLLALLLGFAFAMAMSRFETRKQAVLAEVNDLGTTYLRAHLLPDSRRAVCVRLLEEYVQTRIDDLRAGTDRAQSAVAQDATRRLQVRLWGEAVAAARENPDEVRTGYFVESLNGLIDDHGRRAVAMENHVPEVILHLLMLVATLTIAVTGYSSGLRGKRLKALRVILVLLIAATLIVVIDLDRPRRGMIRVGEEGMLRLQADMGEFHLGVPSP
jgi:CDP-diglyceride synthetase